MSNLINDIEDAHKIACQNDESLFCHPQTGYMVMTSKCLIKRKKCCGNSCMFCPYGHFNVPNHVCDKMKCPHVNLSGRDVLINKQIEKLSKLSDQWDGYCETVAPDIQVLKIIPDILGKLDKNISIPSIHPVYDGSLHIVWKKENITVTIDDETIIVSLTNKDFSVQPEIYNLPTDCVTDFVVEKITQALV